MQTTSPTAFTELPGRWPGFAIGIYPGRQGKLRQGRSNVAVRTQQYNHSELPVLSLVVFLNMGFGNGVQWLRPPGSQGPRFDSAKTMNLLPAKLARSDTAVPQSLATQAGTNPKSDNVIPLSMTAATATTAA